MKNVLLMQIIIDYFYISREMDFTQCQTKVYIYTYKL